MSEKKIPAIRIQGFMDEWEQNRLSDYLETSKEINLSGKYSKKDVLSVSGDYGIVNQIEFQGRSFAGVSVLNYGVVNTDDIVYTKSPLKTNPYGIIKANKGKPGIVSTLYAVYHPKDKVDAEFIEFYFDDNLRLNNYLHPLVNKGAKNDMKVSADNALNGNVIFPSTKDEQVAISTFFTKIENLITIHQRKLTKLQLLKKSMLTKMFPKDGARVPEIRFQGFHDNWGKCKLSDIYGTIRNAFVGTASSYYVDDGHFYLESNNVKNGSINKNKKYLLMMNFIIVRRINGYILEISLWYNQVMLAIRL